jgi:hypothetical protein
MKYKAEGSDSADVGSRKSQERQREGSRTQRLPGVVLIVLLAAVVVLAGCGGSGTPKADSSPTVASLGTNSHSGGSTATTLPKGNATALVDEWATCERSHGDPDQADPIIDSHGGINITVPQGFASHQFGEDLHNATGTCSEYLAAAQRVLRAEFPAATFIPNEALLVQYADCMRTNGVPNYPDPNGDETNLNDINMNSPVFENANNVCGKQINAPAWWINGWGPPGDISSSSGPINGRPRTGAVPVNG